MRGSIASILFCLGAASALGATYRWSDSSWRIYVTGPGSATLSDVKAALPNAPLTQTTPGIWHLRANLLMDNGAKLVLHGTKIGGDVNELRLQSNNTLGTNNFVSVTADWGALDIRSTKVTSWDDAANGPDTEVSTFGRAFVRVRSFLADDQMTPYESRMDILDSDLGYLGYYDAESYGLVWKVNPPKNVPDYGPITNLYNLVNVYGDIKNSHIHHNFFGVYTFGAYGMQMVNNEVDHNIWYGFDPHDDSDYLVMENNNVHHNGTHGMIASQRCDHLIIRNNTSWENGHAGLMLHRYCDNTLVENNRFLRNLDAGIALFDTSTATVRSNVCLGNTIAGIRLSVGAVDCLIEGNEFAYGTNFGLYFYKGIDAPKPGDDGHPKRNRFVNNRIHHNGGSGIFLKSGDDNVFTGNVFDANDGPLWFINGQRNRFESNSVPGDLTLITQGDPSYVSSTSIRNQPLLALQLDAFSLVTFNDAGGRIFHPAKTPIATTASAAGTTMQLTMGQMGKTSTVATRKLQVVPDAGIALVTASIWNLSGDLSKRWLVEASSATQRITYTVGDLAPGIQYDVYRNGVITQENADSSGNISWQDSAVTTGLTEYVVRPH
jgi:parallel beta-helix repeat protein